MLDLKRFCHAEDTLEKTFTLAEMSRVLEFCGVDSIEGQAKLVLKGEIDPQGLMVLEGQVDAKIPLLCQRCMQPFNYQVGASFYVSPVEGEEAAKALPAGYEPLFVSDNECDLLQLVEDELILALPVAPLHEINDCSVDSQAWKFGDKSDSAQGKPNPFAELADKFRKK